MNDSKIIALIKALSSTNEDITVNNLSVFQATEFLADGSTGKDQNGNYKIDIVDGRLKIFEYINGIWTEVVTLGSVISDQFILDERYSSLTFHDPRTTNISKNGLRLSTGGDFIEVGDDRIEGTYLSGKYIYRSKLRLINNDINQSTSIINIQNTNNSQQQVSEIKYTITAPSIEGATGKYVLMLDSLLYDIKQDSTYSLTIYNSGETINPIYQTVKDSDLKKDFGIKVLANTNERKVDKLMFLIPNNSYDIIIKFKNPTLVGGSIINSVFKPKLGYKYIVSDIFELYDSNNLTGEKVRDLLHTLSGLQRLKSSHIYNQVNSITSNITINTTNKNNYINGLILCENQSGTINVEISSNVLSVGDKITIKQNYINNPTNPTVNITQVGGLIDNKTNLTLYTGQSVTLQYVAVNNLKIVSKHNNIDDIFVDMKEPTGFVNGEEVNLTFNNTLRQLTISPKTSSYDYYYKGLKHKVNTNKTSSTIFNISGKYYFYIDENGNLSYTQTYDTKNLFEDNVYVACIYWSSDKNKPIYFGRETHGISISGKIHEYLHSNFGARYSSGLGLFDFSVDGNGTSDSNVQFKYDSGVIYDEDVKITIPTSNNPAKIPIFYKEGTSNIKVKDANNYPLIDKNDITITTRPKYNQNINGVWQLTEVGVNDYWMVHYFATNDMNNPVIGWLGSNIYTNIISARDNAYDEIHTLSNLPFEEFVPIGSVIFKTDSYTNTSNAIIVSTEGGGNYIDFRGSRKVEGVTNVAEHNNLVGLTLPNAHPSSSINVDISNLNNKLQNKGDTVQEIIEAIDDLDLSNDLAEIRIIDTGLPKEIRNVSQLVGTHRMRIHMRNIGQFNGLSLSLNGLQIANNITKAEGYSTIEYSITQEQSINGTNLLVNELPLTISVLSGNPKIYNASIIKRTNAELIGDGSPFGFDFNIIDIPHIIENIEDLLGNHYCSLNLYNNVDLIENISIKLTLGEINRIISHNLTSFSEGVNTFQITITQENVEAFEAQLSQDDTISVTVTVTGNNSSVTMSAGEIHIEEFDNKNRHVIYNVESIDDTNTLETFLINHPISSIPTFGKLVAFNKAKTLDNLGVFGRSNRFNLNLNQGALINIFNNGNNEYFFRMITPYYNGLTIKNNSSNITYEYNSVDNVWNDTLKIKWGNMYDTITNQTDLIDYVGKETSEIRIYDSGLPKQFTSYQSLLGNYTMIIHMNNVNKFGTTYLRMNDNLLILGNITKQEGVLYLNYTISQSNIDYLVNNNKDYIELTFSVDNGSPNIYGYRQSPNPTFINGTATWGNIGGTISNQLDLTNYINQLINASIIDTSTIQNYEDNNYIYTAIGINNAWYVERVSLITNTQSRYPTTGNAVGIKPTTLSAIQALNFS